MTQKELAARLGRPAQAINEIIKAKKSITPETAIGLGKVLGIDPQFWTNLEAQLSHDTGAKDRRRTSSQLVCNGWTTTPFGTCSRGAGYKLDGIGRVG